MAYKEIDIPLRDLIPCARAYNNSIIDYGDKTYMFYRYEVGTDYRSDIAICELTPDYTVKPGSNKRLVLTRHSSRMTTLDDPRGISFKGGLYVMHNQGALIAHGKDLLWCTSVALAKINDMLHGISQEFWLPAYGDNVNRVSSTDNNDPLRERINLIKSEKNWTPFIVQDELYFAYTLNPLEVFHYDTVEKSCRKVSTTACDTTHWKWGDFLAGSTPFQKINDEYFGFFHSHLNDNSGGPGCRTYYVGAMAFSASAPFKVTRISKKPVIKSVMNEKEDLRDANNPWRPNVIFPCGFVKRGDKVIISCGWQDVRCKLYEFDYSEITKNMKEIK